MLHARLSQRLVPRVLPLVVVVALTAPFSCQAEGTTKVYRSVPSVDELGSDLFGVPRQETQAASPTLRTRGLKTRGLSPEGQVEAAADLYRWTPPAGVESAAAEPGVATSATADAATPDKLAFNVRFDFDSTRIRPDSLSYIDVLGKLLRSPEAVGKQVVLVGHTDATGSDSYNYRLSVARAAAVRDYLLEVWQVDPGAVIIDGRGESQLLASLDPFDPTHRRVEFWARADGS